MCARAVRRFLAGKRPSNPAVTTGTMRLDLRLLGDLQGIFNLDAEVPGGTLELGVSEQQLDRPVIPGPSVDRCECHTLQG